MLIINGVLLKNALSSLFPVTLKNRNEAMNQSKFAEDKESGATLWNTSKITTSQMLR